MAAKQRSSVVIMLYLVLCGGASGRRATTTRDCMRQMSEPKLVAQDAIAMGIDEVKSVKGFVGRLVSLKSLQFPENAAELHTCAEGVAGHLNDLNGSLSRLRRSPSMTVAYSRPLKFALSRAIASADDCRTAIGHVDAAFADMLMRKLNDLALILDDVEHRVSKLNAATHN
ncbi:hypothetical protein DM860_007727 [Cuscuta australis]|uniref:Pectinesterase inhibitor domain-containing protein n=1 Tax=Cuscuta australis TaxID=267555 RepID=A0A328E8M0_9ASTE|nr:hypothetical protein DM860_007727 [Cuscuta australis]